MGIVIFFISQSGFTPGTKKMVIQVSAAAVVLLAIMIERKGFFSLEWRKKNTVTPTAKTYVESKIVSDEHYVSVASVQTVVTPASSKSVSSQVK